MTTEREQIIAAAKEAGVFNSIPIPQLLPLERFYAIAHEDGRVAEREECAFLCDVLSCTAPGCADDIRARSTK
jgi:hypothetical protein